MGFINWLLGLGASVVLPIIIFILSMIFRMPIGKAVRASLTIGVGFIGINLVIGLLGNTLGPAAQAMVKNTGVNLPILDVGWPVAAAISFGTTSIVPWVFVLGILLNLVLIAVKATKTLNVDMWNYWHFIFSAAFVYFMTGNFVLGLLVALITSAIVLKLADFAAPVIQKHYGIPGITTPHLDTVTWSPLGWVINKGLDRVPGIRKWHASPGQLQEKYGIIAEPMIMGTVLGFIIAILAYYPEFSSDLGGTVKQILTVGITLGAVMLVLPRMVAILMEGLVPLSDAAKQFIQARFPGRTLYIGLDGAILIGHPANIAVGIILVPITLLLALLMSVLGLNQMLPFTDLAVLPFFAIWATTWSRGNVVRGVIIGTFFIACMLSIATFLAPATTEMARAANFAIPAGATQISSIDSGAHLAPFMLAFGFIFSQAAQYGLGFQVWISFILAFALFSYIAYFIYIGRGHVPGIDDEHLYVEASDEDEVDIARGPAGEDPVDHVAVHLAEQADSSTGDQAAAR